MNSNGTELKRLIPHMEHSIEPERLPERVCCINSHSSLLSIYFRLNGFKSSLLRIYFRYGPNNCSHCTKVWHRNYLICDASLSRSMQRSFAPLEMWSSKIYPVIRWELNSFFMQILGKKNSPLHISHRAPCCPQTFCISSVFNFSWGGCNTKEKWKTKVMQNVGRQIRCIMGDVQVANCIV